MKSEQHAIYLTNIVFGMYVGLVVNQQFCQMSISFHGCPHERRHPVLQMNSELEACLTLESSACRTRSKRATLNQQHVAVIITV